MLSHDLSNVNDDNTINVYECFVKNTVINTPISLMMRDFLQCDNSLQSGLTVKMTWA